jgi:histidine ammonia-lyase
MSEPKVLIGGTIGLEDVLAVGQGRASVSIDPQAIEKINEARAFVLSVVATPDAAPVYGVNTGFGALAEVPVEHEHLCQLQLNLIRSHACGVCEALPEDVVRIMLLLRAQVLALGHSGVRLELIQRLVDFLEHGIHPVIPSRGSVGASGDLAPLAHLALVLVGEGEAFYKGTRMSGAEALKAVGMEPLRLEAKEGLSLINGTQALTAVGIAAHHRAVNALRYANVVGAWSLEALLGTAKAFDARIQALRPHPGQGRCASMLRSLLAGSQIMESHADCSKVQDPYSLRCMPQVHGAVLDALEHIGSVLEREVNSVTDNPLVFSGAEDTRSGGNFHGAPVAFALDYLAVVVTSLMSISERRIEQLVNPHLSSGLPPFLMQDTGLNSGFMIAQVSAASLVSEGKVLAHPASVDSIPSSANREDHVSMGMTAALKAFQTVKYLEVVLGIETMCAAQGLDFRAPLKPGSILCEIHGDYRNRVPFASQDSVLAPWIDDSADWVRHGGWQAHAPGL